MEQQAVPRLHVHMHGSMFQIFGQLLDAEVCLVDTTFFVPIWVTMLQELTLVGTRIDDKAT